MIDANQIRTIAAQKKIDPGIIEKDYVLSKVVMSLSQIDQFNNSFLFKGGTALKKCFYSDWRFSEDLDFTSRRRFKTKEIKSLFTEAVDNTVKLFGLSIRITEYSQFPKTGNEPVTAQLKLGYDGPLRKSSGQKNNVRVDIAFDEVIVAEPVIRKLYSGYTDDIDAVIPVYPLEEIAAEKLRSILQRGKSRDYYDVWILLKKHNKDFSIDKTWDILKEKCSFKKIPLPKVDDFFLPERIEEARRYWERGLAHQLSELPDFKLTMTELHNLLTGILTY